MVVLCVNEGSVIEQIFCLISGPKDIKKIMLNSTEHEISTAHRK